MACTVCLDDRIRVSKSRTWKYNWIFWLIKRKQIWLITIFNIMVEEWCYTVRGSVVVVVVIGYCC